MTQSGYASPDKFVLATQMTLGDLVLVHDRQFIVPLNQRPWAWKDARDVQFFLDDFWKTVAAFFDPDSNPKWSGRVNIVQPPHFLGTFVFFERSPKEFEIFDGQQRMTAIIMLCAVLREIASAQMAVAGQHQQKATDVYGGLNSWLKLSPLSVEPRLRPNSLFRPLFDALIFASVDEKTRVVALQALPQDVRDHAISKKLVSSFNHIRAWVHDMTDAYTPADSTNFLAAAHDVLRYLFSCIETRILDEEYAYEVFQCLNARGENLTEADNIKNELFKESKKSDHPEISNSWNEISENVPNQDVGEFLRRRHIALIAPCKQKDTYDQIKKSEIAGSPTKTVVAQWYQDSRLIKRILGREAGLAKKETLERLEVIFDILNVGLAYIPILSAAKVLLPVAKDDFHECVCVVEKYVFRALTVGQMDTAELERKLGEAARIMAKKNTVKDFRDYLKAQSDDLAFGRDFSAHMERRTKVQYYILRELEIHLLGGGKGVVPGDHHSAKNHIEHVLPKRLSNAKGRTHEWNWARANPDKHQSLVNRLGNLIVLEHDINKSVGNHEFAVKQDGKYKKNKSGKINQILCYTNSALKWPERLCDTATWPEWTEADIEKRQKDMAADALKVWSF